MLVNFANPDMVGHTGVLDAAIHAVEAVDAGVGQIVEARARMGGAVLITADHGNCELMKDPATGQPHTAHTLNPVPLLYVNDADVEAHLRRWRSHLRRRAHDARAPGAPPARRDDRRVRCACD